MNGDYSASVTDCPDRAVSFDAPLRRYTNGHLASITNLSNPPVWWWDSAVQPAVVIVCAAVTGFVLVFSGLAFEAREPRERRLSADQTPAGVNPALECEPIRPLLRVRA